MVLQSQTCPYCEITEAAGAYCTKCLRQTEPGWVHVDERMRRSLPAYGPQEGKVDPSATPTRSGAGDGIQPAVGGPGDASKGA